MPVLKILKRITNSELEFKHISKDILGILNKDQIDDMFVGILKFLDKDQVVQVKKKLLVAVIEYYSKGAIPYDISNKIADTSLGILHEINNDLQKDLHN